MAFALTTGLGRTSLTVAKSSKPDPDEAFVLTERLSYADFNEMFIDPAARQLCDSIDRSIIMSKRAKQMQRDYNNMNFILLDQICQR